MHNCELCGGRLPNRGAYFVDVARWPSTRVQKYQVCKPCFIEHDPFEQQDRAASASPVTEEKTS